MTPNEALLKTMQTFHISHALLARNASGVDEDVTVDADTLRAYLEGTRDISTKALFAILKSLPFEQYMSFCSLAYRGKK